MAVRRVSQQSMTGFGRASVRAATGSVTVELRSTNHRYLEIDQRWPSGFSVLQARLAEILRDHMHRGRVEAQVYIQGDGRQARRVVVDEALARRYHETLISLKGRFGIKNSVALEHLLSLPQLISIEETRQPADVLWRPVRQAVEGAVKDLVRMRRHEGANLIADLKRQLATIDKDVKAVRARLPKALAQQQRDIRLRLRELIGGKGKVSASQLGEAVSLVRDADVNEELVRLDSHVGHIRQTLSGGGSIGKRMDFIAQEMMREVNTLGAKVRDPQISRRVVNIKATIERIREQVQNLE